MGLLTPGLGLLFWMLLTFSVLLFVLGKFGWPVVLRMMKDREENIRQSLEAADKAKLEMQQLQCNNELLLKQAQEDRDKMLKETKLLKEQILEDAKASAQKEAQRIIADAREVINYEKLHAMTELKNQIANLSIEIAEDLLKHELSDKQKSNEIIEDRISKIKL
ncbi:MAG: F0F1 ATP synthase subunit B [Bacteroidales bacterium]|nr:F0F1 ATP synthase subunit B [Bacteroidales bacterium]